MQGKLAVEQTPLRTSSGWGKWGPVVVLGIVHVKPCQANQRKAFNTYWRGLMRWNRPDLLLMKICCNPLQRHDTMNSRDQRLGHDYLPL